MTQKHNTHARTLSPTNHSTTTDYEKVKTIYDYICHNVTYDYSDNNMKFTDCPAAIGRNCPDALHQRERKKD